MKVIESAAALEKAAQDRILIIDGAMGTMIQRHKLSEEGYRGERFKDWSRDVKGNNDLLVLTQPAIIQEIHEQYLEAGADLVETNTFNAQTISMADYGMEELAYEINVEAAKVARAAVDKYNAKTPEKPRFVAGAVGPTNRTASISPDVTRNSLALPTVSRSNSAVYSTSAASPRSRIPAMIRATTSSMSGPAPRRADTSASNEAANLDAVVSSL